MDDNKDQAQEAASEPRQSHRGLRYIGDGIAHYSGIPAGDLSPEQVNRHFGGYDGARAAVARDDAIYAWDGPEGDDE